MLFRIDYRTGLKNNLWSQIPTFSVSQEPKGYKGNAETDIRSTWHKGMTVVVCTEQSELIISLRLLCIYHKGYY